MSGGGAPPPPSPINGGEFLLQLLQKPKSQNPINNPPHPSPHHHHHQRNIDSVGPTHQPFQSSNGRTLPPPPPWMNPNPSPNNNSSPNNTPWGLAGLPPPPNLNQQPFLPDDFHRLGLLGGNGRLGHQSNLPHQPQKEQSMMMFGSVPSDFRNHDGVLMDQRSREVNRMNVEAQFGVQKALAVVGASASGRGGQHQHQYVRPRSSTVVEPRSAPPPGFGQKPKGLDQWGNADKEENSGDKLSHQVYHSYNGEESRRRSESVSGSGMQGNASSRLGLTGQFDHPGPPLGSKLRSVPALDIEESLATLQRQVVEERRYNLGIHEHRSREEARGPTYQNSGGSGEDDLSEQLMNAVRLSNGLEMNNPRHNRNPHDKDFRSDFSRELQPPGHRMRNNRRIVDCRSDIDRMNAPFLAVFESLVPAEEEKAKQKQLLTSLEKLVNKEWPRAQLYLYGSCANSFGVSHSDIDVCLAIEDEDINKSELLLKLADILQEDNLQNVQALTRARVPIVKLMDPVTGISCDICVNNVLAVVNTKLLRDYAQIDSRLRQLAFIVKHWAKLRGVNVTYKGTLSSYAYVLMCIHFLQQRKPAILPCLQGMEATYVVTIEDVECAYFDQVQNLSDFGARNRESIAQLVWAFFDYWAYRHDYANAVICVRTGSVISKRAKDWTRRIGNDRHLICIEDPFELSHDLGRVVDKYSIKILREEFERAANIMQFDHDPCVTLFEPYVPS